MTTRRAAATTNQGTQSSRPFPVFLLCAAVVLGILFFQSFTPGKAHFSNDGPLGAMKATAAHVASDFQGRWLDLNWVGASGGASTPNFTFGLLMLTGAVGYAKFYAPFALLILGLCAWFFFRQLKLAPAACVVGGLAAMLNSGFFSAACWGVAGQCITFGMSYLALGLLADPNAPHRWLRVVLAGLAVGMGLMEGADIGAIFSLFVAAFILYQALITGGASGVQNFFKGAGRTAVVAGCAALIAAQFISVMISTQIKGVAGTQQDEQTKEQQWDWATQWSLPKVETLGFAVPGLFGYRMDTPDGGQYWGIIGRYPGWAPEYGASGARQSGGGIYAGILVLLLAAWALGQSFRKQGSPFSDLDRKWIWFWAGVVLVSLLLAWGKFAPFYKLLYSLPYFSTIRNPAKFTHCANWALVVLGAYGAHGMLRAYTGEALQRAGKWFAGFEKKWTLGLLATAGVGILGAGLYASQGKALEHYLAQNAFTLAEARQIIQFSNGQVGLFIVFLLLAVATMILFQRRTFAGPNTKWAGVLLGVLVVVDLARANAPWIKYYDYREKYASNPVVDFLRQAPHEHRVAMMPLRPQNPQAAQLMGFMQGLYHQEWIQHLFPYYGIQTIDIVQEPRVAVENRTYRSVWTNADTLQRWQPGNPALRHWQLANVQYLVGLAGMEHALNQQMDPVQRRFRLRLAFDFPNLRGGDFSTIQTNAAGPFGLIEFTGALPRAKLYAHWQVSTNDDATLPQLADPQFQPEQTVLVANDIAPPPAGAVTNAPLAPVQFVTDQYTPKQVVLRTDAAVPTVLLLTDKHDPNWTVTVDGQPGELLRCNYLMRGVALPAGPHEVVFRFEPPVGPLYVSLLAVAVGLGLVGYLGVVERRQRRGT